MQRLILISRKGEIVKNNMKNRFRFGGALLLALASLTSSKLFAWGEGYDVSEQWPNVTVSGCGSCPTEDVGNAPDCTVRSVYTYWCFQGGWDSCPSSYTTEEYGICLPSYGYCVCNY